MKTVEIFSGTKSFSNVAEERGHETFTIDNNSELSPTIVHNLLLDIMPVKIVEAIYSADIIWMSPPCTTFSMAAGNTHWTADRQPKTQDAEDGLKLLLLCKNIAEWCDSVGKYYCIENPRARARWFLPEKSRHTVWYCQYGDSRAKPTDIWTNIPNFIPKICKNGNPDCYHERAPRGSKTGTQGLTQINRGAVPHKLIEKLLELVECELPAHNLM